MNRDEFGGIAIDDAPNDEFGGVLVASPDRDEFGGIAIDPLPATPVAQSIPVQSPVESVAPAVVPRTRSSFLRRAVADPAIALLGQGPVDLAQAVVGAAGIPLLGLPGKAFEAIGGDFQATEKFFDSLLSPEQREANRKVQEAKGIVETLKAVVTNPSTITQSVARSGASMLAGGGVAQGILGAGLKGAARVAAIRAAAPAARIAAGAAGEAVISAGQTAESIRQQTPGGMLSPLQAAVAAGSGAATGLLNILGGKAANSALGRRLGVADIEQMLAGATTPEGKKGVVNTIVKVVSTAITEGLLEELPQSAQEQAAQNVATGKPWHEGVAAAAIQGLAAGGLMGAVAGALPGSKPPPAAKATTVQPPADNLDGGAATQPVTPPAPAAPVVVKVEPPVEEAAVPIPVAPTAPVDTVVAPSLRVDPRSDDSHKVVEVGVAPTPASTSPTNGLENDRGIRGKPDTFRTWQEYDNWIANQPDDFLVRALKEQAESESRRILEESTGQRPPLGDDSKRMNRINVGSVYREAARRGLDVPNIPALSTYSGVSIQSKPTRDANAKQVRQEVIAAEIPKAQEAVGKLPMPSATLENLFTDFSKKQEPRLTQFLEQLKKVDPETSVTPVYRNGGMEAGIFTYWTTQPEANPRPYWLVRFKGEHYVVRKPLGKGAVIDDDPSLSKQPIKVEIGTDRIVPIKSSPPAVPPVAATEVKAVAPKGETAKEPWQHTKSEWSAKIKAEYGKQGFPDLAAKQATDATHRKEVEQAIKDGKPVPESVLKDYPDLQDSKYERELEQWKKENLKSGPLSTDERVQLNEYRVSKNSRNLDKLSQLLFDNLESREKAEPVSELTPMQREYRDLKTKYSSGLMAIRLGDFYEFFFDDARTASKELRVALTKRKEVPMAGVPYHAAKGYFDKLRQAGFDVHVVDVVNGKRDVVETLAKTEPEKPSESPIESQLRDADNFTGKAANESEKATMAWGNHVETVVNPLKSKIRKIQSEVAQMESDAARTLPKAKRKLTQKAFLAQLGVATKDEANALWKKKNAEWKDLEKQLEAAEIKRKELEDAKERRGKEWSSAATRSGELRRQVYPSVKEGDVGTAPKPTVRESKGDDIDARYPRVSETSDGRIVRKEVPNTASIESSLNDYEVVPEIRDIPMSEFTLTGRHYSVQGQKRIDQLATQISESGEINPLIVVMDNEGLYILEGATRAEALFKLGAKSFPAKLVIDLESFSEKSIGSSVANPISEQAATQAVNERLGTTELPGNIRFVNNPSPESNKGGVEYVKGQLPKITINLAKHDSPESIKDTLVHELLHPTQDDPALARAVGSVAALVQEADLSRKEALGYSADETAIEATNELIRKFYQEHANSNIFQRAITQVIIAAKRIFGIELTARQAAVILVQDAVKNHVAKASGEGLSRKQQYDDEGRPYTEAFGQQDTVNSRPHLTPEGKEGGSRFTKRILNEAGLDVVPGPEGTWVLADEATENLPAGEKLIALVDNILIHERAMFADETTRNDFHGTFINTLRVMRNALNERLLAGEDSAFSQQQLDDLYAIVQGEASLRGLMLAALRGFTKSITYVARHVETHLKILRDDSFGGPIVEKLIKTMLGHFRGFFTDTEIKEGLTAANAEELIDRFKELSERDAGGRLFRKLQASLQPKKPLTKKQKDANSLLEEEFQKVIAEFKKAGGKVPEALPGQKLTPLERLIQVLNPETAIDINDAIERAVADAEMEAAKFAIKKEISDAKRRKDDASVEELSDILASLDEEGAIPPTEWIDRGLNTAKYKHWKIIRDTNLGYSPTTVKLAQDLIASDFRGTRFNPKPERPADTRIDLLKLATQDDAEVKKVLDAYFANLEANMKLSEASPETRQRVLREIRSRVIKELKQRRQEYVDNLFNTQAFVRSTPSERLRKLLNARLGDDPRLRDSKVKALIQKIAATYVKADEVEAEAVKTRDQKVAWVHNKLAEISGSEKFNEETEEVRAFLEAVTFTYVAERLQAAEDKITRQFLKTKDVSFAPKAESTFDEQVAREDKRRRHLQEIINAGGVDVTLVDTATKKSAIQDYVPSITKLVKQVLDTPVKHQSEFAEAFADKVLKEFNIDPALRDKVKAIFQSAYNMKMGEARTRAKEEAWNGLLPEEKKSVNKRTPLWRRIERGVNAGEFDSEAILKERAKKEWGIAPTTFEVERMKGWAEREQELRTLSEEQRTKFKDDPDGMAKAQDAKERATHGERVILMRKMKTQWSKWAEPTMWNPFKFYASEQRGKIRQNNNRSYAQWVSAVLLDKLMFPGRLLHDVITQALIRTPVSGIAVAMQSYTNDLEAGKRPSKAKFLKEAGHAIVDAYKARAKAIRAKGWETIEALKGRGEVRSLHGSHAGIDIFDRMMLNAENAETAGENVKAFMIRLTAYVAFSGQIVSRASDVLFSKTTEYEEMMHQIRLALREQGMDEMEIRLAQKTALAEMQSSYARNIAEATAIFEQEGITPTLSAIRSAAREMSIGEAYMKMRIFQKAGENFEETNRETADTEGWNQRVKSGLGGAVANAMRGGQRFITKMPTPIAALFLPMFSFSNSIGTGINRKLDWMGLGPFVTEPGESAWYASELDQKRRQVEAMVGPAVYAMLGFMLMAGILKFIPWYEKDKEKRERMIAQGHRPGTIEWVHDDGSFTPFSLNVGVMSAFAPEIAFFGTVKNAMDGQVDKQKAMDEDAAKRGVPAGKAKALEATDWLSAGANALYSVLTGGRTGQAAIGSMTDFGQFDMKKAIASSVSSSVPGPGAWQEVMRTFNVSIDPKLANIWQMVFPYPASGARRLNALGEGVGTPNLVQSIIQGFTGGTYPGRVDPKSKSLEPAYAALFAGGLVPSQLPPGKAFVKDGVWQPLTRGQLGEYYAIRGELFANELVQISGEVQGLPQPEARKIVQEAFKRANEAALERIGVDVEASKAPSASTAPSRAAREPSLASSAHEYSGITREPSLREPSARESTREPSAPRGGAASGGLGGDRETSFASTRSSGGGRLRGVSRRRGSGRRLRAATTRRTVARKIRLSKPRTTPFKTGRLRTKKRRLTYA